MEQDTCVPGQFITVILILFSTSPPMWCLNETIKYNIEQVAYLNR